MQERKDTEIAAALDDRTVISKLDTEQLMSLFGDVGHDDKQQPFIYVEDDIVDPKFMSRLRKDTEGRVAYTV